MSTSKVDSQLTTWAAPASESTDSVGIGCVGEDGTKTNWFKEGMQERTNRNIPIDKSGPCVCESPEWSRNGSASFKGIPNMSDLHLLVILFEEVKELD